MSFPAQVFRILIASPSDVEKEREIAVKTIQEWNDLNAGQRQVVLLPLRWETHSSPEFGIRPQEALNKQFVDQSDLVIGIFWTRIGTPTGVADSGTIEEIERSANNGKPVMLYFSQVRQDPDEIDIAQLSKLREFKKKTLPNALIENYSDLVEFKDKLLKQIEIKMRSIIAKGGAEESGGGLSSIADIHLEFSDLEENKNLGAALTIETAWVNVIDFDAIPDYVSEAVDANKMQRSAINLSSTVGDVNKDYYRQRVTQEVIKFFFKPVKFWVKNRGAVGAKDVFIELNFNSETEFTLLNKDHISNSAPTTSVSWSLLGSTNLPKIPSVILDKTSTGWSHSIEANALQPQRELALATQYLVGAHQDCTINILATIYADILSKPVVRELTLSIRVKQLEARSTDLISELAGKM